MPPFIATLGMMVIAFGMTAIYFDQPPNSSQPISGLRDDLKYLGTGALALGPLSIPFIVAVAGTAAVLFWVLLEKTVFGKNVYAIGGNPQAAQVSGVNIARTLIAVYAIAGACYGVAGVLEAARTGGASSRYGELYELDAIAACVVGGVSTAGGIGRVRGIVAGVLVFSVISYGLTFIGINPFWQQIIKGVIIIGAVAFDMARNRAPPLGPALARTPLASCLEEEHGGRHRDIEAVGVSEHGDAHPCHIVAGQVSVSPVASSPTMATAPVRSTSSYGRSPARGGDDRDAVVLEVRPASAEAHTASGREKTAPRLARMALGFQRSETGSATMTASTPAPSADGRSLPGCRASPRLR